MTSQHRTELNNQVRLIVLLYIVLLYCVIITGRVYEEISEGAEEETRLRTEAAAQELKAEGDLDQKAVPGYLQDPDSSVQGTEEPGGADHHQGRAEDRPEEAEGGAATEDGLAGRAVRADHR